MSYSSRGRKKAKAIAIRRAKAEHAETMRQRWYLTIVQRPCRCQHRGCRLHRGAEMVFRAEGQQVLCHDCADGLGIDYRTSEAWERRQRRSQPVKAPRSRPQPGLSPKALLAELVIEAGCASKCDPQQLNRAWTASTLSAWGLPPQPPKGWRRRLVDQWSRA